LAFVKGLDQRTDGRRHYLVTVRDMRLEKTLASREKIGVVEVEKYLKRLARKEVIRDHELSA